MLERDAQREVARLCAEFELGLDGHHDPALGVALLTGHYLRACGLVPGMAGAVALREKLEELHPWLPPREAERHAADRLSGRGQQRRGAARRLAAGALARTARDRAGSSRPGERLGAAGDGAAAAQVGSVSASPFLDVTEVAARERCS